MKRINLLKRKKKTKKMMLYKFQMDKKMKQMQFNICKVQPN